MIDAPTFRARPHDPARPRFGYPIAQWHRWLAWRPVKCWDGRIVWLRMVYRRRCQLYGYLSPSFPHQWWQYAIERP
ncbi:hypothetical protein [Geminicoccus harenae]|uniref:hypothetical protein n=1 Tax=Geminicoccus harenae TaxID=2498453 RepID=UPI00168BB685|nr:hypothetical protein [Geminicoccus harenae]